MFITTQQQQACTLVWECFRWFNVLSMARLIDQGFGERALGFPTRLLYVTARTKVSVRVVD